MKHGAVVIGALGGSGTRAVARALLSLGVDMAQVRNEADDNLWFTARLQTSKVAPRATGAQAAGA